MSCLRPRLTSIHTLALDEPPFGSAASFVAAPQLPYNHSGALCLEELLSPLPATGSDCLDILPQIRLGRNKRLDEVPWEEYDLSIEAGAALPREGLGAVGQLLLTNPSIHCHAGRLVMAARVMSPTSVQPPCTDVWRSHVVLTALAYDMTDEEATTEAAKQHPQGVMRARGCAVDLTTASAEAFGKPIGSAQQEECARSGIAVSVGLGDEDPRLVSLGGTLHASLNGGRTQQTVDCASAHRQRAMRLQPLRPLGPPLELHWSATAEVTHRNWLLFEHGGRTHVLYSLQPHVVLELRDAESGACELIGASASAIFERSSGPFAGAALHLGAGPLLVSSAGGTPIYYVALFHTKDDDLEYQNYAYTFEPRPPFRVRSVGMRPLPLRGARVRFASGLVRLGAIHGDMANPLLGVAYGVDDSAARLALMPLSVLLAHQQEVSKLSSTVHLVEDRSALAGGGGATNTSAYAANESAGNTTAAEATRIAASMPRLRLDFEARAVVAQAAAKRPHAPLLALERVDSAVTARQGGAVCSLVRGVRYDAPSIAVVAARSGRACCKKCRQAEYCNAFSWRAGGPKADEGDKEDGGGGSNGGGTCWLKQWAGTAYSEHEYVSGHFSRRAVCGCDLMRDHAINGSTIVHRGGAVAASEADASPERCCAACLDVSGCAAWSWEPATSSTGGCRLLRPPGDGSGLLPRPVTGAAAGVVGLKRSVLLVHHQPPQLALGCDRRLLSLASQLRRGGWRVAFAGADDVGATEEEEIAEKGARGMGGTGGLGSGREQLEALGVEVEAPIGSGSSLVRLAARHDAAVVVLTLWFWGKSTIPERYLRALRTKLPHVRLVVLTDDVHHRRLELMAQHEGEGGGAGGGAGGEVVRAGEEEDDGGNDEGDAGGGSTSSRSGGGSGGGVEGHKAGRGEAEAAVMSAVAEARRVKEEELTQYYYADHVLTISATDTAAIVAALHAGRSMHPHRFTPLRHVFSEPPAFALAERATFEARHGLLFVGNLNNPTNLYGLRWFARRVLPRLLRAEPRLTLRIAGSWQGEVARLSGLRAQLQREPAVELLEYVDDGRMAALLQSARVFVVPVRWATGVITKQTLAHVHGLPTVVTPTAAQQIAPAPLDERGRAAVWSHMLGRSEMVRVAAVGSSAAAFADAVLHVHSNASAWAELSLNGARFARSGGDGKGVCPAGMLDDFRSFWSKMERTTCVQGYAVHSHLT